MFLSSLRDVRGSGTKGKKSITNEIECALCNKTYKSKAYLKNHYNTEHPFSKLTPIQRSRYKEQMK